jgi:hypothetical protein
VYFKYEDTPLFVVDLSESEPIQLVLNTGATIPLKPEQRFVRADSLYIQREAEHIKFSERVLMRLSTRLDFDGESYYFRCGDRKHRIARREQLAG